MQTLTAVVKLYMRKPDSAQALVQRVLDTATKDCDSPDVRDRAYIYWRLLSTDPAAAKVTFSPLMLLSCPRAESLQSVILAHRPPISLARTTVSPALLDELISEISTLASVYHKPPETFIGKGKFGADAMQKLAAEYVLPRVLRLLFLIEYIQAGSG